VVCGAACPAPAGHSLLVSRFLHGDVNASRTKTGWWFKILLCGLRPQFEWILSALYHDCKNACHRDSAPTPHTAERYQQFWKFCQEYLFPNMETIIFAQNSKQ